MTFIMGKGMEGGENEREIGQKSWVGTLFLPQVQVGSCLLADFRLQR